MSPALPPDVDQYSWFGDTEPHLDAPFVVSAGPVIVGSYGGSTESGQTKNEDGAMVWTSRDWEFVAVFDAHGSSASAIAVEGLLLQAQTQIVTALSSGDLWAVNRTIESVFRDPDSVRRLSTVKGECAVLLCARNGNHLGWFSVGDNLLFLLHEDLEELGQFALNQRQFYEWVGEVNTFADSNPSFSTGVRQLRRGMNRILLATDGLLEYEGSPFADYPSLSRVFATVDRESVLTSLTAVHDSRGRDSATVIGWTVESAIDAAQPSA